MVLEINCQTWNNAIKRKGMLQIICSKINTGTQNMEKKIDAVSSKHLYNNWHIIAELRIPHIFSKIIGSYKFPKWMYGKMTNVNTTQPTGFVLNHWSVARMFFPFNTIQNCQTTLFSSKLTFSYSSKYSLLKERLAIRRRLKYSISLQEWTIHAYIFAVVTCNITIDYPPGLTLVSNST